MLQYDFENKIIQFNIRKYIYLGLDWCNDCFFKPVIENKLFRLTRKFY